MSKKMKMTETFQCPLFNVKVTEEDSVQIGEDRVWVWGFLAYLTKYKAWSQVGDIPQAKVEEARSKSMSTPIPSSLGVYKTLKTCFCLEPHPTFASLEATSGTLPKLNKHEFWVKTLEDELSTLLLDSVRLEPEKNDASLQDILETLHLGVIYTFSWNPMLALTIMKQYNGTMEQELSGEDFWHYNPVKLVQVALWCKDLRNELQVHIDRFHPRYIPLAFNILCTTIPQTALRQVSETAVSDQDRAIAISTGLTQASTLGTVLANSLIATSVLSGLGSSYMYSTGHQGWSSFYPPDEDEVTY